MKKVLVCICCLALLALACAAALADGGDMFEGQWEDTVSQRAWMRIARSWGGDFDVAVFWGSGIFEGDEWHMTAVFDPTVNQLAYGDGSHCTIFYDGNGNVTGSETHYENTPGLIWMDGDGYLRFLSTDESLNECRFVLGGD